MEQTTAPSSMCIAGDRLNLTLHWLAHTKVKSEVTTGEVSWGILQLDHWIQIQPLGKTQDNWEHFYQDWASSVIDVCALVSMPRCAQAT